MRPSWRERTVAALRRLEANPRVRRALSLGTLLFTIAFLVFLLRQSAGQLNEFDDWSSFLGAFGIGFLLYPVSLGIQAFVWQMIMVRLGQVGGHPLPSRQVEDPACKIPPAVGPRQA